ncbi:virB8 family protein [Sulfurospirillum sp. hDNRA2]|uniref:virB8 family protein n=1 Tax=Sulfurospirillum sp. hDNRA2 TaxID=3237298 RepID=UPI0020B6C699|nr:type IV secretion system protein [Sulfurospirillum sp. DNRA8]MCP3653228.1 type IV secretion system protein [Sulfurospirillum sp. DNRA8]MCR1812079.1 type IV secretion system protein [Sulfurospirillum sp. DNRA8]
MKHDQEQKYNEEDAINYAASIRYMVEVSNRRAWIVAFTSLFLAALSIFAVVGLTPFKTVIPYVVRVNDVTGVVDIISVIGTKNVTIPESVDKHFASLYVTTREGYYFNTLNKDYVNTQIFSSKNIADEYRLIYDGEHSRDKKLKDKFEVEIKILSVVLGESAGTKTATIRYDEVTKNISARTTDIQTKIITMTYDYEPNEKMTESERIVNPLNFRVLTYRRDFEVRK